MKIDASKVVPTCAKLPHYVRRAKFIKRLCFGGFDKSGKMRGDIGVAIMRNGEMLPICWGDNFSIEEVKEIRRMDKKQKFIYIGKICDGVDNFARILTTL